MKGILITLMLYCFPLLGMSQISLTAQLPNNGIILKEQLWNVVITNNSLNTENLTLQIVVNDISLNQPIFNAMSSNLMIDKGLKVMNITDAQPITYNYVTSDYIGNYLPCGKYAINYRLVKSFGKENIVVANETYRVNITPLSSPILTIPINKGYIETTYPQFAWVSPMPTQLFNQLSYDLTVVQVDSGQSAKEAIEFNTPVYLATNIQTPFEKFPTSYAQLQKGKEYAWRVIAKSEFTCISPSEIWTFLIGKDTITEIINKAPFIKLSTTNTEVAIVHQGVIKMEYFNATDDKRLTFFVYNVAQKQDKGNRKIAFELNIKPGQNFLTYDISKRVNLDEKQTYEVQVINSRGEEWFMRFNPKNYTK